MPNYDFYMRGGISLDTRQAFQAGVELNRDLTSLLSNTSINIKTDEISKANKQVLQLQSNLRSALNPTRGTIDLAMLSQQLDRSGASLNQYAQTLTKYGKEGQQAFLSLTKSIASAEAPTTRLSQGIKNAGEQFKRTIGWQISSSAIHGVMSTYNQAIGYAKELNRSLTDIRIVTGQSNAQMANFAKYANAAAKSLSSTTTRYTDAALIYYQQGLSEKAVKDRADITIKMANVAGVSAEKASQQLTAIWNNFDNGTKSLEHYADVLVKLGAETASSSDEISKGVQKFAAIGNTVGLSYEYAASALATVTATTRESADTVGTSFRTLFSRLQGLSLGQTLEDGTTLNKYSKALDTIGVRIKETNGEMKSMDTILDEIGSKWKTLSKDTQIGLAQSVGGARQYASFMALMDNWDYFQENVNRANNASGALQKQQDIYAESWAAASKQVQASMEGIFDSVINDKFVIGATKGFATVLDSVNGLTNGLGGLDGMLATVGSFALKKYAKELPRMWEDIKYNVGYMFNSKTGTIDKRQQGIFSQAYEGLSELAKENGMKPSSVIDGDNITGLSFGDDNGFDPVYAAQIKNAKLALDRRAKYLSVERTLSEREKQEYLQMMDVASMWDNRASDQAAIVQQSRQRLKDTVEQIGIEQYNDLLDSSKQYRRQVILDDEQGNRFYKDNFNLVDSAQRDKYYEEQIAALQLQRDSKLSKIVDEDQRRNINKIYNDQISKLQKEQLQFTDDYFKELTASKINLDDDSGYTKAILENMGEGMSKKFTEVVDKINSGKQITLTEKEIFQQGMEAFQQPLIKASEDFGKLSYQTNKLKDNFNKNSTAAFKAGEASKDLTEITKNVGKSWYELQKTVQKTGSISYLDEETGKMKATTEYKEAVAAYKTLQKALTGETKGLTESDVHKLIKDFELKSSALTDSVEREAWKKGLTDEQTAEIRERAASNKRKYEEQLEVEYQQEKAAQLDIKHKEERIDRIAENVQLGAAMYSAYAGAQGAWDTLLDKNARASDKVGAVVGSGVQMALLYPQLAKSKWVGGQVANLAGKAGGLIGKAGGVATGLGMKGIGTALTGVAGKAAGVAATGGPPGWAVAAIMTLIAVAPKLADGLDSAFENAKEKEERLNSEYATLQQLTQTAKEKQALFEQANSNYLSSVEKFETTELGTIENIKALNEANSQAMTLIQDGNLSYEDYKINDNGLIQIDYAALKDTEEQLARQTAEAQAKYSISSTTQLLRDRKTDLDYYGLKYGSAGETDLKNLQKQIDSGKTLNKWQQENYNELLGIATQKQLDDSKIITSFNQSLLAAAQSDGSFTKEDRAAIASLTSSMSADQLQSIQKQLDLKFDTKKTLWESEWSIKNNAINQNIMTRDQMESLINSQEYKDLKSQDKEQAQQYLLDAVKNQAYLNEYNKLIDKAKKEEKELNTEYQRQSINDSNMGDLKELVESQSGKLYNAETFGDKEYKFVLSQYNKVANDFYKAIGEYLPDTNFTGALENFTLYEAEVLSETLQDFGETFGDDAAKSIYNATLNASEKDREVLLTNLKSVDFSGSTLQSLDQIYELSEDFGGQYTELFEDIRQSFGGDAGIFKTLTNDKAIQKLVSNFEKFGDIDAESIMKASHSSSDLALALELANFNVGGLAAALEGVASGTINENQVSNSLLAGLSALNQIDAVRGAAFDSVDNYDKGRAVTDLTKFAGNLGKTINYNLRNGLMFDEPMMNAWGEMFGENKRHELKQDFISWGSVNKNDIAKNFNSKYKAEKELLEAMQKNPYDFNALWKYAFDTSQVEENEKENDEWIKSGEDKEDTENRSYNSISEHEWDTYLKLTKLDENGNRVARDDLNNYDKDFVDQVKVKVDKENYYKDNYVNIDGAIYKIGQGERDVHWDEQQQKWLGYGDKAVDNNNALFGYDYAKKGMVFTDYFEQQNMSYEDLQNIMQLNLGLSKNTTDRMIAEAAAQNTSIQKIYGDGQVSGAVDAMVNAANENNEYITADQMELIFNNSEDLQAKYQGVGFTGWIRDYLSGGDIDITQDLMTGGKEMAKRQAFKNRYVDFRGAKSNSYEDMDEALVANTGISTSDRLKGLGKQMTINKVSGTKTEWQTTKGPFGITTSKEVEVPNVIKEEVTGFDMSDAMQQLLAMGYTQEAAYEALNDTVEQNGGVLVESIRGVDGSIQTFSSESQAYQDWATQHGVKTEEANAEAFGRFISEQDAVAKAVQQMAIEAQAKAEYERTHNADGTLKTPEQIAEEGGAAEGDVATDENGNPIVDQDGDKQPDSTVTEAEQQAQAQQQGTDEGDTSSGSTTSGTNGTSNSGNYILTQSEANAIAKYGIQNQDGTWTLNNDKFYGSGGHFGYDPKELQGSIDRLNETIRQESLNQYVAPTEKKAVGQNQHKINKHYASGRNNDDYEGLAQVGELGPELSIDKDGNATMLGVNGPTYAYVEKDDIIFTAEQTEDILRTTPDLNNVPGFSGSKGMSGATTGVSSMYIKDNIWDGYGGSSGSSEEGSEEEEDWEPDRYVVIMEQLQDLQREYARLVKAKERAYGADKIKALDAEIAKTNELISAQKAYISEIEQFLQKDIQKLKDEGVWDSLVLDKNGVIRNFDEISEKYKKAAEEGDETAAKQYEAIMKYMETNNLLEQQMDSLIDMQWQLMDARIERITTKVDIKVAVDDTDLDYLLYQLGKINDEAYDVAKALSLIGESMEVNLNKVNAYRQGLGETLQEAFTEIGLDENAQKELLDKIEQGTLTQEDLDNFEISPDHSQNIMNVLLDYRQQLITVNQQLDQLRDQVTDLVVRHFTDFTKDVGKQTSLINTYTNTLQTYANLTELLNGRFQGNMDKVLADINSSISKNAKDSIKNTELMVQAAELKYKELNEMYLAAQEIGDQDTMDKVADARDTAYKELQETNNKYASAWLSANEAFLNEFKFGVNKAIENFQEQLSPLFGTVEALSAAFERQNNLNDQYVDDYEKYYELNKLNRDLQTAIDETDNVNNKKALAKLQAEINKEKASENKLSEYDLEVLKNKVELEKARLALDEAKNAKSTVTLSRDQNGNWGYIYTAEEDKVAQAEQDYEDKLYEYQKANKEYLDDLQAMVIEAQTNMVEAISALDVNDPHYEEQRKSIIDSYMQTVAYVKEQMISALGNQEDSRLVALERYDISMINLKNDFEDLSLSFITGEKNLENYFATLETSMPTLLAQLNELEDKYEANIADINNYVIGNKNIADYMNENMDTLVNKSEEANQKIQGLYDTMVDELADVNKEVADIYNNWLPHIMEMTEKNEILAESISKIQHELSDLSEVEVPPVLQDNEWDHPEGYTENDYGVIRKLTEDEIKLRDEIKKEIKTNDKGIITNYDELKEKWYEEAPAEGEEDKRDADKKAKWELLQKLIGYGAYGDPTVKQTIGLTSVWETIQSNAKAMYKAAETMAQGFKGSTLMVEQTVHINADFSGVTDRNEIQEAFNNLINEAAQYAYRRS